MRLTQTFLVLLISLASGVYPATVTENLVISNVDLSPDGYERSTVVANGAFPGPLLSANKGDTFQINVTDSLTDTGMPVITTIHWHGLFQSGSTEMDGVSMVSQCPIIPGNSYTYNFSVPDQAGTYWYHSHQEAQYCDGLRGPLVLYDPDDPHADLYDVDNSSTVITLSDWYHYLSPDAPAVANPSATLINGLGRYDGGTDTDLAVISVESGKRYRFRIVSMSCDPNFTFSIDNHTFTIIEVDGVNSQPLEVDQIQIFAGQRYSVVLSADQDVDNYWVRALPNTNGASYDDGLNSAILRYVGANETDPTTSDTSGSVPMVETDLHPLETTAVPGTAGVGEADINLTFNLDFSNALFTINDVSFTPPSVPVLLQVLSGSTTAASLLPNGSVYTLESNKVVEVTIPGGTAGAPHPFHLHGHNFWVVRSAGNSTYNYVDPIVRDVVSTGTTGDEVTFRFTTDNPGPWFLHCHIDWHLAAGLAVVFVEAPTEVTESPSDAWEDLCPTYNDYIA
ncbi:laccase [Amylostereum chailletii]|uniref:Laccase 14 n=1 Tax=Amylostereum areolatum TaxID=103385 RepID=A0A873P8U0_9AGAM|nr:laccase [Amylostereum chailletii]QPA20097.1 laccase 14 [Amylostereum areolatum]